MFFCLNSFLDNLDRITAKDYVLTEEDILNVHYSTNGVVEYRFRFDNIPCR